MENKTKPPKTNWLLIGGVAVAALLGITMFSKSASAATPSGSKLPPVGSATLAHFDILLQYKEFANMYQWITSLASNKQKAEKNNRTPDLQARMDAVWYYNQGTMTTIK